MDKLSLTQVYIFHNNDITNQSHFHGTTFIVMWESAILAYTAAMAADVVTVSVHQ